MHRKDDTQLNMKKLRIKFVDFNLNEHYMIDEFIKILAEKYEIELSDSPDYVIYSAFGNNHLNYKCVRIFYTGECLVPNFNECDYGIGFDNLSFGDRYLRIPLYKLFKYRNDYTQLAARPIFTKEDLQQKSGFCSFVYSNCFAHDIRALFFDKLSKYKHVSSGGRFRNNIGGAVKDKKFFQAKHKFAIAFENCSYEGYCTEKLMEAFAAGCVPIYYGDPRAVEQFNPESFINVHDYASLDEVVEKVKEIDKDDEKYLAMRNANPVEGQDLETHLAPFLYHIFNQEIDKAFRRPFSIHSIEREKAQLRYAFFETHLFKYFKKLKNTLVRIKTGTLLTSKRTK